MAAQGGNGVCWLYPQILWILYFCSSNDIISLKYPVDCIPTRAVKTPFPQSSWFWGSSNAFEKWVIVCNCHQFQPFITRKIFHFILVLLAHQLNFLIIFYLILDEAVHSSFVKETIIYNSLSSCYIFIHTKKCASE